MRDKFGKQRCLLLIINDNLIAIIDVEEIQIDGFTKDVLSSEPLESKYEAFGWNTQRIDGNDISQVYSSIQNAIAVKDKPSVIIADTIAVKA